MNDDMMTALSLRSATGPESLHLSEVRKPLPQGGEVLVRVECHGINYPDLLATKGLYQHAPPLPYVPGCEIAGTVAMVGPSSRFSPGDRVAAFVWDGGFAEFALAPDPHVMRLPRSIDFDSAAALVVNFQTALFALRERGRATSGQRLLVLGAGGGIGTAAIQIGVALGMRVIAGISDESQRQTAVHAGASETLDVSTDLENLRHEFDMIIDPLGDRYTEMALRSLRPGGSLLIIGFAAGAIPTIKANRLLLNNISAVGVAWGAFLEIDPSLTARSGEWLAAELEGGRILPAPSAVYDFSQIPQALSLLEAGGIRGKAVAKSFLSTHRLRPNARIEERPHG